MHFWLTFLHISTMAIWFAGLFFLPRLLIANARAIQRGGEADAGELGGILYFRVMTPAAAATIALGIALLAWGFEGPWLPAKLILVAVAVLQHVFIGQLLFEAMNGRASHPVLLFRFLTWVPLLLMLAVIALASAKPQALPPLGGV